MNKGILYGLVVLDFLAFHVPGVWLFFFLLFPEKGTGGASDAAFNAGLVLCWGGAHSLMARSFARQWMARVVGEDFVKLASTVIAGAIQCVMLYGWRPLRGVLWEVHGPGWWVLTGLFIFPFVFLFYCSILLDYMEVLGVRRILRRARGEPPARPVLCLKGPYRYCRHPVYLATMASLWVGPGMTAGRLEFAVLVTLYILVGTILEERDTRREFGEAYDLYREHVPMWIPRLRPWKGAGPVPDGRRKGGS